ncbi:MAG: hypothetical protein Q8K03_02125 [Methylotenera sp.]|nr:hypothetical protein [Methylotenera sp.]
MLIAVLLTSASGVTFAGGYTPNAGSILQEIKPLRPSEPASNDIDLTIEKVEVKKQPCEPSDNNCLEAELQNDNKDKGSKFERR